MRAESYTTCTSTSQTSCSSWSRTTPSPYDATPVGCRCCSVNINRGRHDFAAERGPLYYNVMMSTNTTRAFGKREQVIGIGLTFGLIIGVVIGSMTGNMGWWVVIGLTVGICIGVTSAAKLK